MTTGEVIALCALVVSALSVLIVVRKTTRSGAAAQAKTEAMLEQLLRDVKAIREELTSMRARTDALVERVVVVEQSSKSAHHRLDDVMQLLEEKGYKMPGRR